MESIFFSMVGISITISIIVLFLLLLSSYFDDRYTVKWRYFIWLILAIRLVVPVDFGLTAPPMELNFNDYELANPFVGDDGLLMSEESGDMSRESLAMMKNETDEATGVNETETIGSESSVDSSTADGALTLSSLVNRIYLTGVVGFLLWQLGIYVSFRHATRRWFKKTEDVHIVEVLERLKAEIGIQAKFKIVICKKIISPMIIGLLRPILLLPHEGYQKIDLEVILKHELIHYKRNDLWFKLLLICANALHWFNPFIYIMVREANKDIEISCDEEVLKGADLSLRKRYTERILELMRRSNHLESPISTNFNGGKGMMKSRIHSIFDERMKKRGILSFLLIVTLILGFSACRFEIGQNQWKVPISMNAEDVYGWEKFGNRASSISDTNVNLTFDLDRNGIMETTFSLHVTEEGEDCYLKYRGESVKSVRTKVLDGVEPGVVYGLQAANLEDANSIQFLVVVDYHGMPFGSGYWEIYSWRDGEFERVDLTSIEDNLQMRILEPEEIADNTMNAGAAAYLFDMERYPVDYPAVGLFFKDDYEQGKEGSLREVFYAPMSEYDVEGYRTWRQEALNKRIIEMNFVPSKSVEGWKGPAVALLETKEVVFITLPNVTAAVTRYYQFKDGKWASVDAYIE